MRHEPCAHACCLERSYTTSTIPKTSSASHLDPQPGMPCGRLAIMQGSPGSSSRCAESIGVCGRGPETSYSLGWNSDSSCQTRSPSSSRMIPGRHSSQVAALLSPPKTPSGLAFRIGQADARGFRAPLNGKVFAPKCAQGTPQGNRTFPQGMPQGFLMDFSWILVYFSWIWPDSGGFFVDLGGFFVDLDGFFVDSG